MNKKKIKNCRTCGQGVQNRCSAFIVCVEKDSNKDCCEWIPRVAIKTK